MSTLYIHLPCKATADLAPHWLDVACPYALVNTQGAIEREAIGSLTDISATIAKAHNVVILLAASDVTLLQVSLPPLSSAKLKAALPNLVEEQLLGNPADCVVIAGEVSNGLRSVAVMQRAWLEKINQMLISFGAQHISVLPAQLCLPHQAGRVIAAITQFGNDVDLTLRLSEQTGMGLAISAHQPEEAILNLSAVVPDAPIALYVHQASMLNYQAAINDASLQGRISLAVDTWSQWITGARNTTLNLMAGLNAESGPNINWQPWRWALILATAILFVNIFALNFDWWQMKNEAATLRATMTQIYQARYPRESVIIDPIAQMQQKIALAKRDSGLASPDDFTMLAANFGEAWSSVTTSDKPAIAKLEYREHSLFVGLKANQNNDNEALVQQMQAALTKRNLSLTVAPAEQSSTSWKIRSAK